jgi:spore coat protein CotH
VPEAAAGTNWIQQTPRGCKLPFYQLKMASADVTKLQRFPRANDTYPATFVAEAAIYSGVQVRDRGDWARTWPKKSLKILFDHDQPFGEQHSLNLNSGWHDPAFVREPLAYHLYAACGAPAPRSRLVRLHLNGQFRGLYVEVEQPDKAFLRRYGLEGASLFKAVSRSNQSDERNLGSEDSYRLHYKRETHKTESLDELAGFCRELARATNTLEFFSRRVDLPRYINYLAATVLAQNWDCYNKNHYLVHDERRSQKWLVIPWDLDRTFGDFSHYGFGEARLPILHGTRETPGTTGWNRLADRFFSDPVLRARFLDRLEELLGKEFTTGKLFPVLDRFGADIQTEAALDRRAWGGGGGNVQSEIAQVKSYIQERRAYLLKELATFRENPPASGR